MTDYARLDAWIDAHFDEEVRFLQELVRVPTDTPPGNNAPHAERTTELLQGFGLEAEAHPVPAQEVRDYGLQSITNLIVRREYGAGGLRYTLEETMRAAAAPSDPAWQQRWERAVDALGLPVHRMPSGAGHDAMKLHEVMPQAMLFVRGQNSGISHNPRESTSSDDIQLAVLAFLSLLDDLANDTK